MNHLTFKQISVFPAVLAVGFSLCACRKTVPAVSAGDEYAPVSSLSVSQDDAAALSGKMHARIYYANASGTRLVPETVLISYEKKYRRTDALARELLTRMLQSPQNANLQKTMAEGTSVRSVVIAGNSATVDLSEEFYQGLPSDEKGASLVLASVVTTLTELKEITFVTFVCGGTAPVSANRELNFSGLTRSGALVSASAEIATLAELEEDVLTASLPLSDEETALE